MIYHKFSSAFILPPLPLPLPSPSIRYHSPSSSSSSSTRLSHFQSEILTEKGYARALSDLLVAAGISDSRRLPMTSSTASPVAAAAAASNIADAAAGCSGNEYKELLEKYERLGRQHAETILELGRCQRDLRQLTEAGLSDVIEI